MRQPLTVNDEPFLTIRSLSVDYKAGCVEESHSHSWAQIVYATRGAIRIEAQNKLWMLPQGRAIFIPAQHRHRLTMPSRTQLRTLYCNTDQFRTSELRALSVSLLLHAAIVRVCDLGWLDGRISQDQTLTDIILDELSIAESEIIPLKKPDDKRAKGLMCIMMDIKNRNKPLDELFKSAALSRRTGERLFEKETGLTPGRWRRIFLLSCALEALAEGKPIEEASNRAGFKSRAAFNDAIKQLTGEGPGAVKKRFLRQREF